MGGNRCFIYFAAAIALLAASSACATPQRESLERYPSASLSLFSISAVGCDGTRSAWVLDSDGYVHHVGLGNYLGDAYGKIADITDREVRFVELHQSKTGDWAGVPKTLRLRDGLSAAPAAQPAEAEPQESACH
ncbi:MAG TPA: pilus assembly protein PilP [Tahibacter sp.]|nr:pilus assembly protein PilP [Tahibacter sp.]